jgi:hypothetical protein
VQILKRNDIKNILLVLAKIRPCENDLLHFMKHIYALDKPVFIEMIEYTTNSGKNFLHVCAYHHYDKIIRYLNTIHKSSFNKMNVSYDGLSLQDIYANNTIEQILKV